MRKTQKISEFKDNSLLIVDDDNPFREIIQGNGEKGFQVHKRM